MSSSVTSEATLAQTTRQTLSFTVDSALLRELGERLVGAPHVALAELIKNAYDADASRCIVRMSDDSIEIVDNGHGMTFGELREFWMRVGSPHKEAQRTSRRLGRPLTGSKGIGRLAVQFLARTMTMETRSDKRGSEALRVEVDWSRAVQAGDLQQATADCWRQAEVQPFAHGSRHGVRILLSDLNQDWDTQALRYLARQVWMLRPPDLFFGRRSTDRGANFDIELETPNREALEEFTHWQEAVFDRWNARLRGHIRDGRHNNLEEVVVEFKEKHEDTPSETYREVFRVETQEGDCHVEAAEWQILVFNLSGHMGGRIKVEDVREYFQRFGGVSLYDASFRLPYYEPIRIGSESRWTTRIAVSDPSSFPTTCTWSVR